MRTAVSTIVAWLAVLAPHTASAQASSSTGSGIVVSVAGEILTNAHVVENCETIGVQRHSQGWEAAVLIARDKINDLAVLRINTRPASVALFREGAAIRAGDTVVAMGYPLSGLLATGAKLTVGNVSALAGLGDDSRFIQISAPVQPGNSGGPLLDTSGHLVGIVTQKLNVLRVAPLVGGDIAQNVNFALKTQVARTFLDSKGIAYQRAPSEQQLSPADVGEMARPFTVFVECRYKSSSGAATAALPERSPPATNKPSPAPQQSPKVAEESFKKGNTAYAAKNYAEAMRWFRQAADNGSGAAMSSIGQMYRTGQGVSQDYGEAMVWFHKAAGKGIASAMNSIGFMYAMGEGVAQDHRVALHWFRAAAENGDRSAMANVAQLLATGEGGAKDCDAARGWLERAAAAGFEDAKRHLRSGFDGRCLW